MGNQDEIIRQQRLAIEDMRHALSAALAQRNELLARLLAVPLPKDRASADFHDSMRREMVKRCERLNREVEAMRYKSFSHRLASVHVERIKQSLKYETGEEL